MYAARQRADTGGIFYGNCGDQAKRINFCFYRLAIDLRKIWTDGVTVTDFAYLVRRGDMDMKESRPKPLHEKCAILEKAQTIDDD